jgi:hypothetical protein
VPAIELSRLSQSSFSLDPRRHAAAVIAQGLAFGKEANRFGVNAPQPICWRDRLKKPVAIDEAGPGMIIEAYLVGSKRRL